MATFYIRSNNEALGPAAVRSMDAIPISQILGAQISLATSTQLSLITGQHIMGQYYGVGVTGVGLTYDGNSQLTGGTITGISVDQVGDYYQMSGVSISAAQAWAWLYSGQVTQAFTVALAGADNVSGSVRADLLRGYAGNDTIDGGGGSDTIWGGSGDDVISLSSDITLRGDSFLRGEEGNDSMVGGRAFDDMHGNQGEDTLRGGAWNDWVVGGQDNDLLFGDDGNDVVYGNLGNDTVYGDSAGSGAGDDWVRGGQGNDSISAGAGADLIWGDRGDDTISGGQGADVFHSFSGAGLDRIIDFNAAEGDRLILDGAPSYSLRQEGSDTVVDLGGADRVVLVGVSLSGLPAGWIAAG